MVLIPRPGGPGYMNDTFSVVNPLINMGFILRTRRVRSYSLAQWARALPAYWAVTFAHRPFHETRLTQLHFRRLDHKFISARRWGGQFNFTDTPARVLQAA